MAPGASPCQLFRGFRRLSAPHRPAVRHVCGATLPRALLTDLKVWRRDHPWPNSGFEYATKRARSSCVRVRLASTSTRTRPDLRARVVKTSPQRPDALETLPRYELFELADRFAPNQTPASCSRGSDDLTQITTQQAAMRAVVTRPLPGASALLRRTRKSAVTALGNDQVSATCFEFRAQRVRPLLPNHVTRLRTPPTTSNLCR